jgi:hypothetical protein
MEGTQMAKAKKRKQQQSCKIMRTIDTIGEAASTAMKIYKAVEPIIKAILANGRRIK